MSDVPVAEWRVEQWVVSVNTSVHRAPDSFPKLIVMAPEREISFKVLVNKNSEASRQGIERPYLCHYEWVHVKPTDFDKPVEEVAKMYDRCPDVYRVAFQFNEENDIVNRLMQQYK